jgi:hypothetical protein
MPVEQDQNEPESMPPGYRQLTQAEFDRLKLGLSLADSLADRGRLVEEVRRRMLGMRPEIVEPAIAESRSSLKRKLDARERELVDARQQLETQRKHFLGIVALLALPLLMSLFLFVTAGAKRW